MDDRLENPHLAPPAPEVEIDERSIVFRRYPYAPASVYPDGALQASEVEALVLNFRPPALHTRKGELLFLPPDALPEVRAFAERHEIPSVRRLDVWALVLEPFMDTSVDRAMRRRMREALRRCGLSGARLLFLRWRVSFRVEFIHCLHVQWQHFGLADVLDAMQPLRSKKAFARFYAAAMRLAASGPVLGDDEADPAEPLRAPPSFIGEPAITRP
jgi:hypothetical protein